MLRCLTLGCELLVRHQTNAHDDEAPEFPAYEDDAEAPNPGAMSIDGKKGTPAKDKAAKPVEAAAPKDTKKKARRVVKMMTEEEMDEIENTVDGSKDHLKVGAPKIDTTQWAATRKSAPEKVEIKIDGSKIPLVENEDGEQVMRFFWLDAYEAAKTGTIYLFGKVYVEEAKEFVSCCVTVKNLERNLFFLPRETKLDDMGRPTDEKVKILQVYQEVEDRFSKLKIPKFDSKPVTRNYAFEDASIPAEASICLLARACACVRVCVCACACVRVRVRMYDPTPIQKIPKGRCLLKRVGLLIRY